MVEQLWETLDLIGQLNKPMRLLQATFSAAGMQAWFLIFLLVLEQEGYGPELEIIENAVEVNLPIIKRGLAIREALERELPLVAHDVLDPVEIRRISQGTQTERDAYVEYQRAVYRQHKEDFDAFWQRHPELKGEEES